MMLEICSFPAHPSAPHLTVLFEGEEQGAAFRRTGAECDGLRYKFVFSAPLSNGGGDRFGAVVENVQRRSRWAAPVSLIREALPARGPTARRQAAAAQS
jgi:hypothetical protein